MIKETVLLVCIFGICSAGKTLVRKETKPNAVDSSPDDLEGAETIFFGFGGYGSNGGCCGGGGFGVPNGYEAYNYGGYGGDYGGGYGGYGGGYGGYGGGYGDYGGCCG